jgi:hypothetical protein
LTGACHLGKLKYMSRFIFAALGSMILAGPAAAQQVPGRDLFEFPLGLVAEPAALSTEMAASLWNPAAGHLAPRRRAAFGVAELYSPQEQGVRLAMAGAEYAVRSNVTATASIATAWVTDLLRTETDPQTLGGEIPYASTLLSLGLSASRAGIVVGAAARYRSFSAVDAHGGTYTVDAGVLADRVLGTPLRVAASTFLFHPAHPGTDASYNVAADVPLVVVDSTGAIRAGYAFSYMGPRGREGYPFASGRYRQFDLNAGVASANAYGSHDLRWRIGAGLHYAGYTVAIGREDGAAGLGASYQFLFKRVIP